MRRTPNYKSNFIIEFYLSNKKKMGEAKFIVIYYGENNDFTVYPELRVAGTTVANIICF